MKELEKAFEQVIKAMGLDINDPNLEGTPHRLAKMYKLELFKGVYNDPPKIKTFPNSGLNNFLYTKVPVTSTCAHHFQPIKGVAHICVDYTKSDFVAGLSKFNRLVDWCASRPTLQEDLTGSILTTVVNALDGASVFVMVKATHHCVTDRGVCANLSDTITEATNSNDQVFIDKCMRYVNA